MANPNNVIGLENLENPRNEGNVVNEIVIDVEPEVIDLSLADEDRFHLHIRLHQVGVGFKCDDVPVGSSGVLTDKKLDNAYRKAGIEEMEGMGSMWEEHKTSGVLHNAKLDWTCDNWAVCIGL
ncbi:hypothetical protein A2U01_0002860 [Trifolium medium]|uniref:Uncharacterized protein n=1 Tax=Trifolium medium TaxID=97028 RepID=A0A392M6K1_9FABA|nr:hypothetical protein [Trifolium medium]